MKEEIIKTIILMKQLCNKDFKSFNKIKNEMKNKAYY